MRKVILGALLLLSTLSFSQETEFKFSKEGFTDYVVTKVDSTKTQSELYKKSLEWVQVTYNNPKEVIKAQIENDYIRIEGVSKNAICMKALGMNTCSSARYQIEITFKDGKYKFDVISVEQYVSPSKYSSGGWYTIPIDNTKYAYKDNGEIRNTYKQYPENLENLFNSLNLSLKDFLLSKNVQSKSKEW